MRKALVASVCAVACVATTASALAETTSSNGRTHRPGLVVVADRGAAANSYAAHVPSLREVRQVAAAVSGQSRATAAFVHGLAFVATAPIGRPHPSSVAVRLMKFGVGQPRLEDFVTVAIRNGGLQIDVTGAAAVQRQILTDPTLQHVLMQRGFLSVLGTIVTTITGNSSLTAFAACLLAPPCAESVVIEGLGATAVYGLIYVDGIATKTQPVGPVYYALSNNLDPVLYSLLGQYDAIEHQVYSVYGGYYGVMHECDVYYGFAYGSGLSIGTAPTCPVQVHI